MNIKALLFGCLAINYAAAQEVRIDTRLLPEKSIRVGQAFDYEIDVLTDTWLTGSPDFSVFEVPDTLVTFEGSQGRNIQRTLDGKRYFGITFSYRLQPLTSGIKTLPELQIEVPIGQTDDPVAAAIPARTFAVQPLPAEAAGVRLLAADVQLSQRLLPDTESFQSGQPLVREIRITAHQTLPLSLPDLSRQSTASVSGTRLPSEVKALTDSRGYTTGGERIERIRYLPETADTVHLPALELVWWDIDEGKVKRSELPALEISVIAEESPLSEPATLVLRQLANRIDRQFPGGLPLLMLVMTLTGLTCWHYRRALLTLVSSCDNGLRRLWNTSAIAARRRARQDLGKRPPELTATYRLIHHRYDSSSIRQAPLEPLLKQELLQGVAYCYAPSPDQTQARRTLRKAIRRLARRVRRKVTTAID